MREEKRGSTAARRDDARDRARDRARERYRNTGRGGGGPNTVSLPDGVEFLRLKAGKIDLSILPFTSTAVHQLERPPLDKGEIWWRVRYKIHRSVGPNNETIVCPTTIDKKCPICEERGQLFSDNKKDEAKLLFPSWRNLIMVEDPEEDGKIAVLDISEFAFWERLSTHIKIAEDEGLEDIGTFYWPTGRGYILRTWFEDKSFGAGGTFLNAENISFRERPALSKKLLTQADDVRIQECLNIPAYRALQIKYLGLDEDADDAATTSRREDPSPQPDEEPDAPPPPPKRERKPREEEPEKTIDDLNEDALLDLIQEMGIEVDPKKLRRMDEDDMRELIRSQRQGKARQKTEEDPPPAAKEEKKRTGDGSPKRQKKPKDGECPFGHTFGEDNDAHDDCRECNDWPACSEEYERTHESD